MNGDMVKSVRVTPVSMATDQELAADVLIVLLCVQGLDLSVRDAGTVLVKGGKGRGTQVRHDLQDIGRGREAKHGSLGTVAAPSGFPEKPSKEYLTSCVPQKNSIQ